MNQMLRFMLRRLGSPQYTIRRMPYWVDLIRRIKVSHLMYTVMRNAHDVTVGFNAGIKR